MDLRTFKEKLDQLGSQNNHLEVEAVDSLGDTHPIHDVGVFDTGGELKVYVGDVPSKPEKEKTNSEGVPISAQAHDLPPEEIGKNVKLPEPEVVPTPAGGTAESPVIHTEPEKTSDSMINGDGKPVTEQKTIEEQMADIEKQFGENK